MRIYSNKFELTQPVERQIYVAPNSIYAIGVKVTKNGQDADGTLSVFVGSSALTPMEATVDGYTLYQITSTAEPSVVVYDVVYTKDNLVQHFKLIGNTTNSTVFDIDQQGGAMALPIASTAVLGGVKVGDTLDIATDGVLNVNVNKVALKNDIPVVPTKTSDLQNDSGYITQSDIPAIPTKTSELENDSSFIAKGEDITTPNLNVSNTAQLTGTVTVNVENFLDATTGSRAIEQHMTHNFQVEYEDGTTAQFDVWVNG